MMAEAAEFLVPERARYLAETAEQARAGLNRFVGCEVDYDVIALQLLDEWIDRHLQQFPNPSPGMCLLWISFLGEMFRHHYWGEWIVQDGERKGLAVLCPTESGGLYTVDVSGQIDRRIAHGISASLVYFYTITCIELKAEQ